MMDQLEQLLDMIEHPDRYTEQQVCDLLSDPDLRKHYDVMVNLRTAYEAQPEVSPYPSEGRESVSGMKNTAPKLKWHSKVAAIFIGIVLMSGIVIAAIHFSRSSVKQEHKSSGNTLVEQSPSPVGEGRGGAFDNTPLADIMAVVSKHYGHQVVFANDSLRQLRITTTWNEDEPLSTFLESMNELDGLHITEKGDTIFVEPKQEEGAE